MPEWERYIKVVVTQVKFPFDRSGIAQELRNHLEDIYEDLCDQGIDQEKAVSQAVTLMGNGKTLGQELNRVHHPVIGWIWFVSRLGFILFAVMNVIPLLMYGLTLVMMPFQGYSNYYAKEVSPVVYTMDLDEKVKLYDLTLTIDRLNYHEDGTLEVRYKSFQNPLGSAMTWSYDVISFADETGTEYYGGSSSLGGIISYHQNRLEDFSLDHTLLRVQYADQQWLEIPIAWEVTS